MYAIIETGGKQYWVKPDTTVKVDKLTEEKGKEITFKALWSCSDVKEGDKATSGPTGKVVAEVVRQFRAPKIIVFKKRRKKAYKKIQGHRQYLTELRIKSISLN